MTRCCRKGCGAESGEARYYAGMHSAIVVSILGGGNFEVVDTRSRAVAAAPGEASGTLTVPGGLGPHDHVCWGFHRGDEFRLAAGEVLAEGIALGERACSLSDESEDVLRAELRRVDGMDAALRRGPPRWPRSAAPTNRRGGRPRRPSCGLRRRHRTCLEAGFAGLRVAADVPCLVRTPDQLAASARYEHLARHHDPRVSEAPHALTPLWSRSPR